MATVFPPIRIKQPAAYGQVTAPETGMLVTLSRFWSVTLPAELRTTKLLAEPKSANSGAANIIIATIATTHVNGLDFMLPPLCGLEVEGRSSRTTAKEQGKEVRLSGKSLSPNHLMSSQII